MLQINSLCWTTKHQDYGSDQRFSESIEIIQNIYDIEVNLDSELGIKRLWETWISMYSNNRVMFAMMEWKLGEDLVSELQILFCSFPNKFPKETRSESVWVCRAYRNSEIYIIYVTLNNSI